jgi:hypothetical protein
MSEIAEMVLAARQKHLRQKIKEQNVRGDLSAQLIERADNLGVRGLGREFNSRGGDLRKEKICRKKKEKKTR